MSAEAHKWAADLQLPDPSMKTVLLQLGYMHRAGRLLFPSQPLLAEKTGLSRRAVCDALKLLELFNLIERKARSNGIRGRSSDLYTLHLEASPAIDRLAIRKARKGLRNSHIVQRAPRATPPRTMCRGIGELVEEPNQEGTGLSVEHYAGEADGGRPMLRLLVGGKP